MEKSTIVEQYLQGLRQHLSEADRAELAYTTGATAGDLARLKEKFPSCPDSLLQLLGQINGTYFQQYGDHRVHVLILGSDVFEYPYYLKGVERILQDKQYGRSIR